MKNLASGQIAIHFTIPHPALTSIGIAVLTVSLKLLLIWLSRARFKDSKGEGKRLIRDDYLVWSDFVVIGLLALFFLAVTRNKAHNLSDLLIGFLSAIIIIGMAVLPSLINDFTYIKDKGELGGRGVVWGANACGLVIFLFCVALGAEVHG
jgi:phosphoglycerol transferase MdoB-like AlkP superfamily enzyme